MTATDEDRRKAVEITITLSGRLVTAALTMLTVEGAFAAYAHAERDVGVGFLLGVILSALSFVLSIVIAGHGITKSRNSGYKGNWDIAVGKNHFNWQAITLIIGLALFAASISVIGAPKEGVIERAVFDMQNQIGHIEAKLEELSADLGEKSEDLDALGSGLEDLRHDLETLQEAISAEIEELRRTQSQD